MPLSTVPWAHSWCLWHLRTVNERSSADIPVSCCEHCYVQAGVRLPCVSEQWITEGVRGLRTGRSWKQGLQACCRAACMRRRGVRSKVNLTWTSCACPPSSEPSRPASCGRSHQAGQGLGWPSGTYHLSRMRMLLVHVHAGATARSPTRALRAKSPLLTARPRLELYGDLFLHMSGVKPQSWGLTGHG